MWKMMDWYYRQERYRLRRLIRLEVKKEAVWACSILMIYGAALPEQHSIGQTSRISIISAGQFTQLMLMGVRSQYHLRTLGTARRTVAPLLLYRSHLHVTMYWVSTQASLSNEQTGEPCSLSCSMLLGAAQTPGVCLQYWGWYSGRALHVCG